MRNNGLKKSIREKKPSIKRATMKAILKTVIILKLKKSYYVNVNPIDHKEKLIRLMF